MTNGSTPPYQDASELTLSFLNLHIRNQLSQLELIHFDTTARNLIPENHIQLASMKMQLEVYVEDEVDGNLNEHEKGIEDSEVAWAPAGVGSLSHQYIHPYQQDIHILPSQSPVQTSITAPCPPSKTLATINTRLNQHTLNPIKEACNKSLNDVRGFPRGS